MIKAVFCDLDGTLLHGECEDRESHNSIPKVNQVTLQKLIDSGVKFIPSSGRSFWEMAQIMENFEHNYLVSNNGTTIHKDGGVLLDNVIDHEDSRIVRDTLLNNNISFMIKSISESFWGHPQLVASEEYAYFTSGREVKVITDKILDEGSWISFCVIINSAFPDLHELEQKLQELVGEKFDILPSGSNCIDILIRDVNKGSGAEFVMNLENWAWDQVATVGDNLNDVPMLKNTQHSFAMSHGRSETKRNASYTIDLAAQAFEKILEINKINNN